MALPFTIIAIILPYEHKETTIFQSLRRYHSTPSLLNNQDTDSFQDISSYSPQHETDTSFESFIHTPLLKLLQGPKRFFILLLIKTIFVPLL